MQITDVDVSIYLIPLKRPIYISTKKITQRKYATVEINTDIGIKGIGLTYEKPAILIENIYKNELLGKDPMERNNIWEILSGKKNTSQIIESLETQAIGAIDIALWDIAGKYLKMPLYKLLGGVKKEIPCYASIGYYEQSKGLNELVDEARAYVDQGFNAVKIRIGKLTLKEDIERVRVLREEFGSKIEIMVDANNVYNRFQALKMGRLLENYNVFWFEEPISSTDIRGNAMLADKLDIPIAGGELETGARRFKELLNAQALDIIQPDIMVCGGISEWLKISTLSEIYGVQLAPHSVHDIHIHLASVVSNCIYIEFFNKDADITKYSDLYIGYREPKNGLFNAPDLNGLGLEINNSVKKYKI